MWKKGKKIAVIALAVTFLTISISSLAEEIESRKMSIIETSGENAFVVKANNRKLKATKGMNLGQGNKLSTGKFSKIYIETDNDQVLCMEENTDVVISKASPKSLKLTLNNGDLFFNVDSPLAEDEDMTFEAAHTSMSIRGTSGVFSFNPLKMEFYLVEGNVEWDLGDGNTVNLKAGETIQLERDWDGQPMGPGAPVKYTLKTKEPFEWTDLNDEGLSMIMENRELLDLTAIGLDTEEALQQANTMVEEYLEEQKKLEKEYEQRNHAPEWDDNDWTPSTAPSIGSDSNSEEPPVEEPPTEEPPTEAPPADDEMTREELIASLIPDGGEPGVNGDIIEHASGDLLWCSYDKAVSDSWGYWTETYGIDPYFTWDEEMLMQNGYLVVVLEEYP